MTDFFGWFRNRIQEVPHYLAVDQSRKALVISIRGTLSLADMFTGLPVF